LYFDTAQAVFSSLPDPGLPGPFEPKSFLYGSERNPRRPEYARKNLAMVTGTADISAYFSPDPSMAGLILDPAAYHDRVKLGHWGYDQHAVPLNGKVWYPEGAGPFSLVVFVHGNHDPYEASELGYDWLGSLLASRGYVFVSIDENFLNGRTDGREGDARAVMLLEHARTILSWNGDPSSPLYGRLDTDKLVLAGHSRGGEAAATAAVLNSLSSYPDNAAVRFGWDLPVRAVVALAPTEGLYRPARRALPLPNVDYLVLQGSADGDVDSHFGLRVVNRGRPGASDIRSSFWIYGANHAQFNTDWAKRQDPYSTVRANLLTVGEQQKAAGTIISAFLEVALERTPAYGSFLRNWLTGRAWLPATVYLVQYRDGTDPVADFEEDGDVLTATRPEWTADAHGFERWAEGPIEMDSGKTLWQPRLPESAFNEFNVESWVLRLKWTEGREPPVYTLRGPAVMCRSLSFDMAAFGLPTEDTTLDFTITAITDTGREISARFSQASRLAQVPGTWAGWKGYSRPEIPSSFVVPLSAQPVGIAEIRFRFDGTPAGTVLLDNVAVREDD
jgi:dienelactone hydrolase